jgi:hypothetical protein
MYVFLSIWLRKVFSSLDCKYKHMGSTPIDIETPQNDSSGK